VALTPVRIWLGPAGSGKTHRARSLAGERCWAIVPSEGATRAFPKLASGESAAFTFRRLAERMTGLGPREIASPALRSFLLHQAVRHAVTPGSYFERAASQPGFAPAIGDLIREFKQGEVTVDAFLDAASACAAEVDDPCFLEKCECIAAVWCEYDRLLSRHETRDADDLLAQAMAAVDEWRDSPERVVVDGFTSFTSQQIGLLAGLQRRGIHLEICLTYDPSRPVLFARVSRTREELRARLAPVEEETMAARARHLRTESLRHLEESLFAPAQSCPCDGSVRIHEAPDPVMEAEMAARAVHRLHEQGVPLGRIAVVQRRLDGAATLLKSTFARYEIPVAFHAGEPLGENPLVSVVSSLIRLFLNDWPRAELLRCAKSSYFGLPPEEAALLERWAITRGVRGGQRAWREYARRAGGSGAIPQWINHLGVWQGRLRNPADPFVFAKLMVLMAGDFRLTERARSGDPRLAAEDERAWRSALSLLWEIAAVESIANEGPVEFSAFADAVLSGWASSLFNMPEPEEEHIEILEAFDARQQEFDAVFLLALNERIFPRVVGDDPFLRDDEREVLARHGIRLARQVELADEERALFYRVITAPSRHLVLSYARTGADGSQTLPSYYLEEVRGVFAEGDGAPPTIARTLADVVPDLEDAVGLREKALCAAAAQAGYRTLDAPVLDALLAELAAAKPELFANWQGFLRPWNGHVLRSEPLREWVQRQARDRCFSPSELESFLACPHRHFLSAQLRIREVSEEAGAEEIGTLLHAVLRVFFRECSREAGPDAESFLPPDAMERLEAILDALLPEVIHDPRRWRVRMIHHAAREYLERFLEEEYEYLLQTRLVPSYFELAFGPRSASHGDAPDPASSATPLVISSPDSDVEIAGTIDRVDRTPNGEAVVVTDYKLSRGKQLKEMLAGTSLQMPLYLLAMEQVFGLPAVAAVYRPLREEGPYWLFRPGLVRDLKPCGKGDGVPAARYAELIEVTRAAVLVAAGGIRAAECAPMPGEICDFCPFPDICRPDEAAV